MTTLDLDPIKERLAAATERLPEEARMDAYYYGFDRTGCGPVDAVLSAVAIAGKGSHNTDGWTNRDVYGYYDKRPGLPANPRIDDWTGGSAVELIQLTAKASAEKVKTLSDDIAALVAEVERLKEAVIVEQNRRQPWVKLAHQNAQEVKRLKEQIDAVKALHRPAHAVFSWNGGTIYEDPCPECHGAPGVHPCGCWTDTQIEYVCAECHRLGVLSRGVYDYTYPCPTIHALEAA